MRRGITSEGLVTAFVFVGAAIASTVGAMMSDMPLWLIFTTGFCAGVVIASATELLTKRK
jgi:hypothetical protein